MNRTQEIAAILGLIIASCACVAGWLAIPQVQGFAEQFAGRKESIATMVDTTATVLPSTGIAIQPTPIPLPTIAQPTLASPTTITSPTTTPTPSPTASPRPSPTNTLVPTPTPLADTPPGITLQVGDTWRQGGIELQLLKTALFPRHLGVGAMWQFRNIRLQDVVLTFSLNNFDVRDNAGRRLDTSHFVSLSYEEHGMSCTPDAKKSVVLKSGDQYTPVACGIDEYIFTSSLSERNREMRPPRPKIAKFL
jgi:hypothetical protein